MSKIPMPLKKLSPLVVIAILVLAYLQEQHSPASVPESLPGETEAALHLAYKNRQSDLQVHGQGTVSRLLPDDLEGSRHQKFILKLDSGQALLIAHNIDLAPRIDGLRAGDTVEFYGEYEWNPKGGVIHWTHHDPDLVHAGGWLKHKGHTYQ